MNRIGIIGWRGMVGSVLLERMREEKDFDVVEPTFFSTSQAGGTAPDIGRKTGVVQDAHPGPEHKDDIDLAIRSCPERAISYE